MAATIPAEERQTNLVVARQKLGQREGESRSVREARAVLLVGKEGAEKDTILVGTPEVEAPVAVRFCWRAGVPMARPIRR